MRYGKQLLMTSAAYTCPYCNAFVTVPAGTASGERVPCPRCGESFAYHPREDSPSPAEPVTYTSPAGVTDLRTIPRRLSNRTLAGIVLGVMGVMAILGLVWALKTVPDRRINDRKEPIGYLPSDVDIIAMVQVTRTMETPAGRDLMKQLGLGPGAEDGLINLEKWTGLKAEEIDQVVLGLKVMDGRIIPRMTVVVETRQPYDSEALRKTLRAKRSVQRNGKTLYPFQLPFLKIADVPAELWCPTETLLVIGLEPNDLDAVPLTPQPGLEHLSPCLQGLLSARMGKDSTAILVADTEDWEKKVAPLYTFALKPRLAKHDAQIWSQVHALGLYLRFDEAVHLKGGFRLADKDAAQAMQTYLLKQRLADPDAVEIHEDVLVTFETQTSGDSVRQLVKRGAEGLPGIPKK